MSMQFRDLAEQAKADGTISADVILGLRREGWSDGKIDQAEAEALFAANDHFTEATPEWTSFFIEALTEFVVNGGEPRGYVDDIKADWLASHIDHDGRLETLAELELLVRIMEKALRVPPEMRSYALDQIEQAVFKGTGPTRDGGELLSGCVSASECALLRRMIFAAAGDRPAAVSKAEAEMLFRIKDASLESDNAPEWELLFVQGVANFLMGFGGNEPLSQQRAVELEAFMNSSGSGIGKFFGNLARADVGAGFGSLLSLGGPSHDIDTGVEGARAITDEETSWLHTQLEADDQLDPFEKALLAFIADETGEDFKP
jgi:hypothetical protein